MAPRLSGFTRASSLGPIADFMERRGSSASRVLREVDLPLAVLERPDLAIPLRDQFRFLERAARHTGDRYFGARLGQAVSSRDLSNYGAWVCSGETLLQSIERAHAGLHGMLQTSTVLRLSRHGKTVRWSIEFVEPESEGRRHNELLGVSYLIDMVRNFAGSSWRPDVVMTTLPAGAPKGELEDVFRTNVSHGHQASIIEFDAALLGYARQRKYEIASNKLSTPEPRVPRQQDALATIESIIELALYDGYPRIDWVACKLAVTRRTLQRLLETHGSSFNKVVGDVIFERAKTLLTANTIPVTEIALELGYRDAAHFSRAFKRWSGVAPIYFRSQAASSN